MRRMLDPKEVGGGGDKPYIHSISISSSSYHIYINIYSNSNTQLTFSTFKELMSHYGNVICTGFYKTSTSYGIPTYVRYDKSNKLNRLYYFDTQDKFERNIIIGSDSSFSDIVSEIV